MNQLVTLQNDQPVTSSLQVAENFDKQHKHVLDAIEAKIQSAENSAHYKLMFAEGEYKDSRGRKQRLYYMNRDGFTFIAMGFTGTKADSFKLKYIEAFNEMENHIKQQELDTSKLSPELQMFNGLFQSLAKQEMATKQLETKIDNITEIVALNTTDWRKGANNLINKVVNAQGGGEAHKTVRNDIYKEVERRGACSLSTRLTNKRRRMADEGVCKSKRDKLNQVDVIEDDKKLIEIYMAVVKDFAIKHGVYLEN